jgi:hypothetical protein
MGLVTKTPDGQMELLVQFLEVPTHEIAHLHVLEVVPATLVPRIQVWGISRQELNTDLALRAGYELLDLLAAVNGRADPRSPGAAGRPHVADA